MLKYSVTSRMVGTFAIVFSSKTLGFRKSLSFFASKPGGSYDIPNERGRASSASK